jgi:hypothetical protein
VSSIMASELKLYDIYRDRVDKEHELIDKRAQILLVAEASMFSPAAIFFATLATNASGASYAGLAFFVFAVGGITAAWVGHRSIEAARAEIASLQARYRRHAKIADGVEGPLPALVGAGGRHRKGHALAGLLPSLMAGLWLAFGAAAICASLGLVLARG